MSYHLYADNMHLYLAFDSCNPGFGSDVITQLEACIPDIQHWMLTNRLKLNDDKTEFLKFVPQPHPNSITPNSLLIGSEHITTSTKAKNLGVLFDPSLTLSTHQLYCLSRIKRYLPPAALKMAVHALISSKLNWCNSLLVGLPKSNIQKYQHIMNSAASMISGCSKFDHITPVLVDLHCCPSSIRKISSYCAWPIRSSMGWPLHI